MFTKFWEKITENLAHEWQLRMMAPAFAFWAGGLLLFAVRQGWQTILNTISTWNTAQAITALVAALGILTISTTLITQFTVPILRGLEGYWRGPLGKIATRRVAMINQKIKIKEERWSWLAKRKSSGELTSPLMHEYALLDADLASFPVSENWRMPTRLGNLLRSAEEYAHVHYGLEVNISWPRLWLLLPLSTQQEVARARQNLDRSVQTFTWALLFGLWSFWNPLASVIAIILALVFYQSILQSAGAYGELLKSAYDLYRFRLYDALHWPKPQGPGREIQSGQALINYLHRAEASQKIKYDFSVNTDITAPVNRPD